MDLAKKTNTEFKEFRNEPYIDFTIEQERVEFQAALDRLNQQVEANSLRASLIIDGEVVETSQVATSVDPSKSSITLGTVDYAEAGHVDQALISLSNGRHAWAETHPNDRAAIIERAAARMAERKRDLSALIIREAGKPWKEADADVAEAIDFCRYYALEMRRRGTPFRTMEVLGEENTYFYQPRGIVTVIAPWNFPFAIPCGMVTAALVAGNAVVLKPAEQSSLIAAELVRILHEVGVPGNALAFLPGKGESVGAQLVEDPRVDMICFTGSKEVGLQIIRTAAEVQPGQKSIKKVVAELGGKNCIIVDEDADLDEAIKGVIYSAFGFSGQKCSACSRVVVVGDAYETFIGRMRDALSDLIVGNAADPSTYYGPVIDNESQQRILACIEAGEKSANLVFKGTVPEDGYYVPVTFFRDVQHDDALWCNEIFGPVLACAQANDFDHALEIANNSEYALTGGLFSRSPANIQRAYKEFRVGNLYINRGCTGAIVCRQPFGGFGMSGIGSKAGGPDYLLQFMEPRTVTENTMRRGFTPELA